MIHPERGKTTSSLVAATCGFAAVLNLVPYFASVARPRIQRNGGGLCQNSQTRGTFVTIHCQMPKPCYARSTDGLRTTMSSIRLGSRCPLKGIYLNPKHFISYTVKIRQL